MRVRSAFFHVAVAGGDRGEKINVRRVAGRWVAGNKKRALPRQDKKRRGEIRHQFISLPLSLPFSLSLTSTGARRQRKRNKWVEGRED